MASTYLQRASTGTNGNRKTWTFSCWIKRTALNSGSDHCILSMGEATNDESQLKFADDTINFFNDYATTGRVSMVSNPPTRYRDLNGWYHLVFTHDVTETSNDDRWKIWINGDLMPASYYGSPTIPNEDGTMNEFNGMDMWIGARAKAQNDSVYFYLNANLSHVHFIDGTAYDASAFGEFDANGVWKIKTSPSVTYGTNGFFILKDGNSVTDQSGNSNNFTVAGGTLTNTLDCPDNVFATMNPLDFHNNAPTLSNGNLTVASTTSNSPIRATMGFSKGKWYAEYRFEASDNDNHIGCHSLETSLTLNYTGGETYSWGLVTSSGDKRNNNVSTSYGSAIGYSNSIVMIAIDKDNGKIWWGKDGTWFASGDPANGTNEAFSNINTVVGADGFVTFSDTTYRNGSWNFGNGYFGTTPVASAGTNASGIGIFEYDVPTGYTALSTKGLDL